ncbi:MAG: succinylglutamate desuccinylase/aspartoacylase family protein [Syntrophomonadaceae bacterium]
MKKVRFQVNRCLSTLILGIFIFATFCFIPQLGTVPTAEAQTTKTVTIAPGTKYATPLYIIDSGKAGPTVMIVGGVHGNETAGYKAAAKVTDFDISKGRLLVLPRANQRAVEAHTRALGGADLNRDFPKSKSDSADNTLSKAIFGVVKGYGVDWLMDMHEGANYQKVTSSSSVGQSCIYYPDSSTRTVATRIVNSMNANINTSYKKFSLLRYPVSGSLSRAAAVVCGTKAFIFETCSRDPLDTRIDRQIKAANILLGYLGMK